MLPEKSNKISQSGKHRICSFVILINDKNHNGFKYSHLSTV